MQIAFANIRRLEILRGLCHTVTSKIVSLKSFLGPGESSAIALALESENPLLILDDKKARRYAQSIGLDIIKIVGLLAQANTQGLLDNIDGTLSALKAAGFWLPANHAPPTGALRCALPPAVQLPDAANTLAGKSRRNRRAFVSYLL
jgi:predicted nucleic acid-binding protein